MNNSGLEIWYKEPHLIYMDDNQIMRAPIAEFEAWKLEAKKRGSDLEAKLSETKSNMRKNNVKREHCFDYAVPRWKQYLANARNHFLYR